MNRGCAQEEGQRMNTIEIPNPPLTSLTRLCAPFGLAAAPVGAFDDEVVRDVLGLRTHEEPLYLIAVGEPRQ